MTQSSPIVKGWLPDETVYSLVCRQHTIAGFNSAAATCTQIFGHARQGSAHDLPCHLERFAA